MISTDMRSWIFVSLISVLSVNTAAPSRNQELRDICGLCHDVQMTVHGLSVDQLFDKADREQASGDFAAAVRTMCGGMCSGTLLRDPGSFSNMGVLLKELGFLSAAKACYRAAIRLQPWVAGHWYRMGNALLAENDLGNARQSYAAATRLSPSFGDAYNNLGNCFTSMSLFSLAAASYRYAVRANPHNANYYCNLGGIVARENVREGIKLLEQGLALNPLFPEVYNNLANFQRDLGQLQKAASSYEEALRMLPDSGEVLVNLLSVRAYLCEWKGRGAMLRRLQEKSEVELANNLPVSLSPFYAQALGVPPEMVLRLARHFALTAASRTAYLLPYHPPTWYYTLRPVASPHVRNPNDVRVGLLSSDLSNHIVGHGVQALLLALQPSSIKVWCYALTADDGSTAREQIRELSELSEVSEQSDLEIASLINSHELHVLIDLNGHTKGNRMEILSLRPARVQTAFHGYAGTSGAPFVDLFIADRVVAPPELSPLWTERLLLMPSPFSFFLFEDYGPIVPVTARPGFTRPDISSASWLSLESAAALKEGFRYVCFNSLYKVTPETFSAWTEIMKRVEGSVVWLLQLPEAGVEGLKRAARKRKISPSRLLFSPLFPREEHVGWKSHGGLFLDSLLYNGHSTAADALAAGVPLLTRPGPSMPSRVSSSLLLSAGMPEALARTVDEYVELGVRGGKEGGRVAREWRGKLERTLRAEALFDREGWTAAFRRLLSLAVDVALSDPDSRDPQVMHVVGHV